MNRNESAVQAVPARSNKLSAMHYDSPTLRVYSIDRAMTGRSGYRRREKCLKEKSTKHGEY